jgi:multicomponent Na+:H+ antiporter subunit E
MNEVIDRDNNMPGRSAAGSEIDCTSAERPIAKRIVLFFIALIVWVLLIWPPMDRAGRLLWPDIAAGLVVAALVAMVMREIMTHRFIRLLDLRRYFWALIYLFVFAYYVLKGNIDVAYRVLHPAMPIRPGIVMAKTKLRSASARTLLANSITLTPGTLTLDLLEDGILYVHWINIPQAEDRHTGQQIIERFEWLIQKVLE